MTARLTPRGVGVAAASVVCLVAGELLGHAVLRVVAGAGLAAVVVGIALCARRVRVSVERTLSPDRVHRGDLATATLVVTNRTTRTSPAFHATDPPSVQPVAVAQLRAGKQAVYSYALPTGKRGRVPVGPLTLDRADLLGLASGRTTAGTRSTLWVHPRVHHVVVHAGAFPRHHHDGVFADPPMRGSADLRAVREYVPGDEPRHVHWRATARTGRLMVRELYDPARPRFAVLLDVRAGVLAAAEFESAVDVAASFVAAAVAEGCRTRLSTTAGFDASVDSGLAGRTALLDVLCEVEQVSGRSPVTPRGVKETGSVLAYVTGGAAVGDAEVMAALVASHGRVVVLDMGATPSSPQVPSVVTIRETDPVLALARWSQAGAR